MHCAECGSNINATAVYCPYCGEHVLGVQENEDYVYEAFISYRHSPIDREAALKIQHRLEGASIPKDLRTPERGSHLGRLFRDEDELTTADSLPELILDALNKSRFLIVLCSPRSRQSEWVMREVETYAQLHGRNRILPVLVDGEPDEAFPPLLLTRMQRDPETGMFMEVPAEPLAADLRKTGRKEVDKEITRLEAAILGCGLDDLQQRIRMRRLRMNVAISLLIALASLAVGAFALYQRGEISRNLRQSQINESRILARESQDKLDDGDRYGALKTALRALPRDEAMSSRPFVPDAQFALERALGIFPRTSPWYGYMVDGAGERSDSRDGIIAQELYGNTVMVNDLETGAPLISVYPSDGGPEGDAAAVSLSNFKLGDGTVLSLYGRTAICYNYDTLELLWHVALPGNVQSTSNVLYLEEAEQYVFVAESLDNEGELFVLFCDEMTGDCVRNVRISKKDDMVNPLRLAVSSDEKRLAVVISDEASTCSLMVIGQDTDDATADVPRTPLAELDVVDLAFYGDDLFAVTMERQFGDDEEIEGNEDGIESVVTFESFDGSLGKRWEYSEMVFQSSKESDFELSSTIRLLGPSRETEGSEPLLACTINNQIVYLEYATGEQWRTDTFDAPIVAAAFVPQDNEPCIAVCTNEARVSLEYPFAQEDKGEEAYTASFAFDTYEAYPIIDGGAFRGFSAWTSYPPSYHALLMDEHTDGLNSEPAEDVEGMVEYNGESIITVTDDAVNLIDNRTFKKLWSVSFSSLGFDYGVELSIHLAKESVFIYEAYADVGEQNQLEVCELSLKDGSLVNKYLLPWSDDPLAASTAISGFDVYQGKGRRLAVFGNMHACMVYDLDASEVILEKASGDGSVFYELYLSPTSLVTCSSSETRWAVFNQYSLDTGEEKDEETTPLVGMAMRTDLILADFTSEDRNALAVRCFDGVIRTYSTLDGSKLWQSDEISNIVFLARVSSNRLLAQDSSGRCYLLDSNTGKLIGSSEVKLPTLVGCDRMDNGVGLAVLHYTMRKPYTGQSLVTFSLDESDANGFGPIGEVNYGVCFAAEGDHVLINAPWNDGYRIYDRPGLSELIAMANEQVNISEGNTRQ
ncbi:MAG: TIR domain-containing protein [Atopobiaceae bacterium]|nr:TIR domain-containing protein [Atopobiaceae bacterium]